MPVTISHTVDRIAMERVWGQGSRVSLDMVRRGINVQNQARRFCPVDTGRLRSSIHARAPHVARGVVGSRIGSNTEYAVFVEFGTRYTLPQPFLRPALAAAGR